MLELCEIAKVERREVKVFVGRTLVALDTDHIKQYVFATDRLKDIRGASSILDRLNRRVMEDEANRLFHDKAKVVYTNGGSGLFLIEGDEQAAEAFGRSVQKEYSRETEGGASISFAVQKLPDDINPWTDEKIRDYLKLLNHRLIQNKETPPHITTLATHPLMRPCDSCGIQYAEDKDEIDDADPADRDKRHCSVCLKKRKEDNRVKRGIKHLIEENIEPDSYIWREIIRQLRLLNYNLPDDTKRPSDFNELRGHSGGKDYLALIYADGNGMGKTISACSDLNAREQVAKRIDEAVYQALSAAIAKHMPVVPAGGERKSPMFPFDILLIGGDDIVIVTPAAYAMDVALTIAKQFYDRTKYVEDGTEMHHTLSVGIVLAPIKYPFGLLQDLAESTLKFAKQEGARQPRESAYGATRINFLVVAGSTSHDFKTVYAMLHNKHVSGQKDKAAFYATLRPYTVEDLEALLDAIRAGKQRSLGRTKLHQVREAVLKMNLTTSVGDFLAVLRNWRQKQREFVTGSVYTLAGRYQQQYSSLDNPGSLFPRVTYPWFVDKSGAYLTPLLDFVELYDFVAQEGGNGGEESRPYSD